MNNPAPATVLEERPIWSGAPSQWLNFWPFLFALVLVGGGIYLVVRFAEPLLAIVSGVGIVLAVTYWLRVQSTRIEITTERISVRTGVFSRRKRDMELYRVKDTTLSEPFFLRLVSLSHIELLSSDKTSPVLVIPAVRNGESLRQQIRTNVERMRTERRVRELDFE